jgi:hypothetical protein
MAAIATLTLNPSIDGSSEAELVRHTHKIRTAAERFDPGGGGINVARVLSRLGGDVEAMYLAGGVTGSVLAELLERAGLRHRHCRRYPDQPCGPRAAKRQGVPLRSARAGNQRKRMPGVPRHGRGDRLFVAGAERIAAARRAR